jgi:hypothetical protein
MKNISRFFKKDFTVKRQSWTDNKSTFSEVGSFSGQIQKATEEQAEQLGMSYGGVFNIWCGSDTDVENGDTLTRDDTSETFSVKAVTKFEEGFNQHIKLIAIKDEE